MRCHGIAGRLPRHSGYVDPTYPQDKLLIFKVFFESRVAKTVLKPFIKTPRVRANEKRGVSLAARAKDGDTLRTVV
ncbi:MAG: hypothetical protein MZV65_46945 [Chromatiales bacterium]|nr:hypothetical protein [Chromatiales bacterium]